MSTTEEETEDDDLGSPSKKPRMENVSSTPLITSCHHVSPHSPFMREDVTTTTTTTPTAATTTTTTSTTAIVGLSPSSRLVTATTSCGGRSPAGPCSEGVQKDSIIAQILAGAESDFGGGGGGGGDSAFCSSGVYFDEGCYPVTTTSTSSAGEAAVSYGASASWTREPAPQPPAGMSGVTKETQSLLVCMESRGCSLQHTIEQVVTDHELVTCTTTEALNLCNEQAFQLIWLQLPCPPSEDILAVITGIRYSSKLNRKTVQLGVTVTQPEIDLNLHGIDEILLEPVSRATIRQKYFDWTSVKLIPDYEVSLRDTPMSPTTPESSVSTESTIELSLSSLTSDTTNDSGIQGEIDVVDLKPPTPYLFPQQQGPPSTSRQPRPRHSNGRPATPPSWCRVEHATKEKHRRERIKDSCDQLRVLLPYVRGRKTDMASILEMTVDYLKIVNSNLPHEFHAHVLDVMTKGGGSPPSRPPRTHVICGRGHRGGRGRAGRRSSNLSPSPSPTSTAPSPTCSLGLQDGSSQSRLITRAVSRGVMSSPVSHNISRVGSNGGSRGSKLARRSLQQQSMMMSPASQGLSNLYLLDGKERGPGGREETVLSSAMTLPTYYPPSHYTTPHLFNDIAPSPPSSSSSTSSNLTSALSHPFSSNHGLGAAGLPPLSSSSPPPSAECNGSGLAVPRLYASAHLTVEPGYLPHHGPLANPPPSLSAPLSARYTLGGGGGGGPERVDGSGGAGLAMGAYGDPAGGPPPPPPPPPYFHYFSSNMPDIGPAYTMAGGAGVGVGVGMPTLGGGSTGEFVGSGGLHHLTSAATSAFATPPPPPPPPSLPLLQLAPSRGKGEITPPCGGGGGGGGVESGGEDSPGAVYTLMETAPAPKTSSK